MNNSRFLAKMRQHCFLRRFCRGHFSSAARHRWNSECFSFFCNNVSSEKPIVCDSNCIIPLLATRERPSVCTLDWPKQSPEKLSKHPKIHFWSAWYISSKLVTSAFSRYMILYTELLCNTFYEMWVVRSAGDFPPWRGPLLDTRSMFLYMH